MSMTFYAAHLQDDDRWSPVVPFDRQVPGRSCLDLSSANGTMVLDALGIAIGEDGTALLPIENVEDAAQGWLTGQSSRPAPGRPMIVDTEPDRMSMVHGGTRDGYLDEKIVALLVIAATGSALGATHISVG